MLWSAHFLSIVVETGSYKNIQCMFFLKTTHYALHKRELK